MALVLQPANAVKQRCYADTRRPKIQAVLKAFFMYHAQHKGNPDLAFIAFADLAASVVLADAPCRMFGVYLLKPPTSTIAAYVKGSDSATAASATAPELSIRLPGNVEELIVAFDGLPMTAGFAVRSDTTAAGTTGSAAADQPDGFVLLGAP